MISLTVFCYFSLLTSMLVHILYAILRVFGVDFCMNDLTFSDLVRRKYNYVNGIPD